MNGARTTHTHHYALTEIPVRHDLRVSPPEGTRRVGWRTQVRVHGARAGAGVAAVVLYGYRYARVACVCVSLTQ